MYCLGYVLLLTNDEIVAGQDIPHMWCVQPTDDILRCFSVDLIAQKLISMDIPDLNLQVVCKHPYEMEDLS